MPITLFEALKLQLSGIPVKTIKESLKKAESNGLSVTTAQLKAHYLASGDPLVVIDAMVLAKKHSILEDFNRYASINLSGKNPLEVVKSCLETKALIFDTYSPEYEDKIIGYTKDRTEIYCECKVRYNPPLNHIYGWQPTVLQERLSAKLSVFINASTDYNELTIRQAEHETVLMSEATKVLPSVKAVSIRYTKSNRHED